MGKRLKQFGVGLFGLFTGLIALGFVLRELGYQFEDVPVKDQNV